MGNIVLMSFKLMILQSLNVAGCNKVCLIDHVDCNSLTVSLLSTRSLVRHAVHINRTKELMQNDILCLTESQVTNDTDGAEMFEYLSTFKV